MQNGEKLRLRDVIDDDSRKALPDTLFCKHGGVPLLLNRNDLDKKIFLRSQLDNALEETSRVFILEPLGNETDDIVFSRPDRPCQRIVLISEFLRGFQYLAAHCRAEFLRVRTS